MQVLRAVSVGIRAKVYRKYIAIKQKTPLTLISPHTNVAVLFICGYRVDRADEITIPRRSKLTTSRR